MKTFFLSLRTHWIRTLIVLLIVIGGGFILWRRTKGTTSTPTYQTAQVEKGTLIVSVTGSGQVSTANNVQVTTESSGVVKKIYVKNGDQVKVGQKIADLELDSEGQQRYSAALSSYQSAKNSVDAAKAGLYSAQSKLFTANQTFINGVVAENVDKGTPAYIIQNADWLAAEADYKRQEQAIKQAQSALNSAWIAYQQSSPTVYAPLTGTLTGFSLQLGSVITAQTTTTGSTSSQKIASVMTDAIPTITVNLTQIDVPKVKVGNKTTITLDPFPDKIYEGKVVSIDTVGSVSSGVTTYPTVIALDQKHPEIFSNMSAQASITTNSKADVLIVPSTAIQTMNGKTIVRVRKDGNVIPTPVETGLASDAQTEIVSGLNEGDTIITSVTSRSTGASTTTGGTSVFSPFGGARSGGAVRMNR